MKKDKVILWDFDGVLMDSNVIRDQGFINVLSEFPANEVDKLLIFHRKNGGLSRYVKFRYFFEKIRGQKISEEEVNKWASLFSTQMKTLLVNESLLIKETIEFIKNEYNNIVMHIVSGSDENELRYLCKRLNIDQYFLTINGSPTPKKQLVRKLMVEYKYNPDNCILIGDSFNDYEAAKDNNIVFFGYNNIELKEYNYLETIDDLKYKNPFVV